jgi:hypothetical protein
MGGDQSSIVQNVTFAEIPNLFNRMNFCLKTRQKLISARARTRLAHCNQNDEMLDYKAYFSARAQQGRRGREREFREHGKLDSARACTRLANCVHNDEMLECKIYFSARAQQGRRGREREFREHGKLDSARACTRLANCVHNDEMLECNIYFGARTQRGRRGREHPFREHGRNLPADLSQSAHKALQLQSKR